MGNKSSRTIAKGIRLPKALHNSVMAAAEASHTTFTAILVQILAEAVTSGRLPAPKSKVDKAQLAFL